MWKIYEHKKKVLCYDSLNSVLVDYAQCKILYTG